MEELVSVIIPTYNRFDSLQLAIESVRKQAYKNIEIIVVNDASTQKDYYNKPLGDDVKMINLPENMRQKYNTKAAQGLTRNEGIKVAKGKYIAFLDDDDYWMQSKIAIQVAYMKKYGFHACSSNYMKGKGPYPKPFYNHHAEKAFVQLPEDVLIPIDDDNISVYKVNYDVPKKAFDYTLTSTVIIEKDLFDYAGMFRLVDEEDWDLWERISRLTDFMFLNLELMYYDVGHAGGQNYTYGANQRSNPMCEHHELSKGNRNVSLSNDSETKLSEN